MTGPIESHGRSAPAETTVDGEAEDEGSVSAHPPTRFSSWLKGPERDLLVVSTVLKLLLWPCYHSTDFEVHRNWLAITYTLPIRDWYFEATSQWTLDYPPFFAYFSWILAQPAPFIDPLIVSLHKGLEYAAWPAKAYMRATVVVTELVLGAALVAHSRLGAQRRLKSGHIDDPGAIGFDTSSLLAASLFLHPGLIIIDHIHFQYNGFLFGILLWSLWAAREDRPLLCAWLFSTLLNLKHIYMYIAPAFFVYLLRSYIYPPGSKPTDLPKSLERLIILAFVTLGPFLISLIPLMLDGARHPAGTFGVLSQMVSRLFPFSRGLIHAYWAPNAWALWAFTDRVLVKVFQRRPDLVGFLPHKLATKFNTFAYSGLASASRGLVGHTAFGVLPDIVPSTCFILTLTCMLVYLFKLWLAPTYRSFLAAVSLCGFASFLFGWHVHEKAIMLVLVPYTFLAADDYAHFRTFVLLSTAGSVSLFPLLYEPAETPIKVTFTLIWTLIVFVSLSKRVYRPISTNVGIAIHALETAYLYGFIFLQLYVSVLHPLLFPEPPASPSTREVQGIEALPTSATAASSMDGFRISAAMPAIAASLGAGIPVSSSELDDWAAIDTASTDEDAVQTPFTEMFSASDRVEPTTMAPTDVDEVQVALHASSILDATSSDLLQQSSSTTRATSGAAATAVPSAAPLLSDAAPSVPPSTLQEPSSSMEFLPLMMVSVYCSVGVVWAWLRASTLYLSRQF